MGSEEAEKLGLVSRIISSEGFIESVLEIAIEISEKSLPSLMMAKDAINSSYDTDGNEYFGLCGGNPPPAIPCGTLHILNLN